jgi:acyl-CoA dehydrogenase
MSTCDPLILAALQDVLDRCCTPQQVRAIEAEPHGPATTALWSAMDEAGLLDAMLPEDQGGAGLTLAQAGALVEAIGRTAVTLPLAQTLWARGIAAHHGSPLTAGWRFGAQQSWAQVLPGLPQAQCLVLDAAVDAALLSGALQSVLSQTLGYANQREQFGRPIGKFQAIQHQLAVMAEHVAAAQMAARLGCSSQVASLLPEADRVAVAKARCAEAALEVSAAAHAIHGAIGFTEAYDLQLFTRRLQDWRQRSGTESFWQRQLGRKLLDPSGGWGHGPSLDVVRRLTDPPLSQP